MAKHVGGYLVWTLVTAMATGCGTELDEGAPAPWGPTDSALADAPETPADDDPLVAFEPPTRTPQAPPPVLLGKVANPTSVAADPNGVYWTDAAQTSTDLSTVFEQSWGAENMQQVASQKGYPVSLALNGEHVYWVDEQYGDVLRTRRVGDAPLEAIATGQAAPHALAVSDRFVVWTNIGDGRVMAYDRYQKSLYALAKQQGQPASIALTPSAAVWLDLRDGAIRAASLFGDELVTLVEGAELGDGLAVDDTHVYYGDHGERAIMRVSLTGGEPEVVVPNQVDAGSIALAGTTLVWTSERFGEIRQGRIGSDRVRALAVLQADPTGLVITNGRVHWVSRGDGGIWLAGLAE